MDRSTVHDVGPAVQVVDRDRSVGGRAADVCISTIVPISFNMMFAFAGSLRVGTAGSGVDLLIAVIERDIVSYFFHSWNS